MEFLNSKNDLYLGGAVNQIDTLSGVEYICSSDSTQSDIPLSDYLESANGRVKNLSGFIARAGLYNYVMRLGWEFTTAKSEYTTGEFWNLMQTVTSTVPSPFSKISNFGFASLYRDTGAGGIYSGMLCYRGSNSGSISLLPFTNIVVADLEQYENKTFQTTVFWTSF